MGEHRRTVPDHVAREIVVAVDRPAALAERELADRAGVRVVGPFTDLHADAELVRTIRQRPGKPALVGLGAAAPAALAAAAHLGTDLAAVATVAGRGEPPWARLRAVRVPTLLLVPGGDAAGLERSTEVARRVAGPAEVRVLAPDRFTAPNGDAALHAALRWLGRFLRPAAILLEAV